LTGTGTGVQYGTYNYINNENNAAHYGTYNQIWGIGSGDHTGGYTSFTGSGGGSHMGVHNDISSSGNGTHYGVRNNLIGTGNGIKYGSHNRIPIATGGTHYGVYSDAQKVGSYAGYFLGRVVVNNGDMGMRIAVPNFDVHLKQTSITAAGRGGMGFENSANTDNWKIYNSGLFFSFAENGTRVAYITNGTGAYVATSDRRLKKHIIPTKDVVTKLKNLTIYNYLYKKQDDSAKEIIGFMAQDVQPLFPELVETDEDGFLGLNYSGFGVIAIKAIQEQQTEIEQLKQQLEEQKSELLELRNLINGKQ
jgi:hypothetical protein